MQFENGDVVYVEKDGERLRFEVAAVGWHNCDSRGSRQLYDCVTVKPCDAVIRRRTPAGEADDYAI